MKTKLFATLVLLIAALTSLQAQTLTGKVWVTKLPTEEPITMSLVFEALDVCAMAVYSEQSVNDDGLNMNMSILASVPGDYKLNGDLLTIDFDRKQGDVEIEVSFPDMDESIAKMMKDMVQAELENQKPEILKEMMAELPDITSLKVTLVDENTLVLGEGDDVLVFGVLEE